MWYVYLFGSVLPTSFSLFFFGGQFAQYIVAIPHLIRDCWILVELRQYIQRGVLEDIENITPIIDQLDALVGRGAYCWVFRATVVSRTKKAATAKVIQHCLGWLIKVCVIMQAHKLSELLAFGSLRLVLVAHC